jgi:hypothetical protein
MCGQQQAKHHSGSYGILFPLRSSERVYLGDWVGRRTSGEPTA